MIAAVVGQSTGLTALSNLYGFTASAAHFAVQHIETLKSADNLLANRCGAILEAANAGFGVGTETALVLIGIGQSLLGNPLAGGAVLPAGGNPIVMTCAAIGAIHYGWKAMSAAEREQLLATVSKAFEIGVEFVRSLTRFAVDMIKALMSAANMAELKAMVAEAAATFGRRLSQITRATSDRLIEGSQLILAITKGTALRARSLVPTIRRQ